MEEGYQDKLDLKVKSILREAERVLNMELKDESANVDEASFGGRMGEALLSAQTRDTAAR